MAKKAGYELLDAVMKQREDKSLKKQMGQKPSASNDFQEAFKNRLSGVDGMLNFSKKVQEIQQKKEASKKKITDSEIISKYESIPDTNLLFRGFGTVTAPYVGRPATAEQQAYNQKQSLYPEYREAKDRQISSFLKDNDITDELIKNATGYRDTQGTRGAQYMPDSYINAHNQLSAIASSNGITVKDILDYTDAQKAKAKQAERVDTADKNGVLGTIQSILLKPLTSITSGFIELGNYIAGRPIGSDEGMNAFSETPNAMRGAVKENISESIDNKVLRNLANFGYDISTSIGDMGTSMIAGPGSLALMSVEAGSDKLNDVKRKNLTPDQMMASAFTSAAIESLTEKIPLDNLFKMAKSGAKKSTKEIIKNVLKQAGTEASEEAISEVSNSIMDYLITGDESDYMQSVNQYKASGLSDAEARNKARMDVVKNVGMSALAGGVSGGVMAGGASAFSNVVSPKTNTNVSANNAVYDLAEEQKKPSVTNAMNNRIAEERNAISSPSDYNIEPLVAQANRDRIVNNRIQEERNAAISDISDYDLSSIKQEVKKPEVKKQIEDKANKDISKYSDIAISGIKPSQAQLDGKRVNYQNGNLNDHLKGLVNMFGDETTKTLYKRFNQEANYALENADIDMFSKAIMTAVEIDERLTGKVYHNKTKVGSKQKNGKVDTMQHTYTSGDFIDSFMDNEELKDIYASNRNKTNNVVEESKPSESVSETSQNTSQAYIAEDEGINFTPKKQVVEQQTFDYTPNEEMNFNYKYMDDNYKDHVVEPRGEEKERGYSKSVVEKTDLPDNVVNEFIAKPEMYSVLKNADVKAEAENIMLDSDTDAIINTYYDLLEDKNPVAVVLGYELSKRLTQEGRYDASVRVVRDMSKSLTEAGQFSQSAAITMLHNNPEAAKRLLLKEIDQMNKQGEKKFKHKWKDIELTSDEIAEFSKIEPGNKEAISDLYQRVYDRIHKEYPSSFLEKLMEYRRVAMLLNVRTNVRNVVSNALVMPIRWTADRVTALGEGAYSLINPDYERTQAINPIRSKAAKELSSQVFESVKNELLGDSKYNDARDAVRQKQVFKGTNLSKKIDTALGGALTKANQAMGKNLDPSLMETARNFTYYLLEQGDNVFVKKNFESRLASYLDAQGITDIANVPPEAIALATQEAMKATFRDDTKLSKWLTSLRNIGGIAGEALMPFTKTPANIAMRGIDYSPLGVINVINTLSKANNHADVAKAMTQLGQAVTGTAAIALGYLLRELGVVSGALSDDKDEAAFQRQQGQLPYAIKLANGNYLSYDWAQPASIPLLLGCAVYDAWKDPNVSKLSALRKGSAAVINSWFNLSPLQSLADLFGGYGEPADNIGKVAQNFATSFVPSQVRAIAKIIDPIQRSTYSKGSGYMEQVKNNVISGIPGASKTLPASYDTWGNEVKRQDTIGEAAFANLLNPGQFGNKSITPLDDEVQRLYEETGNKAVFPQKAPYYEKINKENIKFTNKEVSEYQKRMGQMSYDIASAFMNSPAYENIPDDVKAETLGNIYGLSKAIAKSELFGYDVENSDTYKKAYNFYEKRGAEGVADYYTIKNTADSSKTADVVKSIDNMDISTEDKGFYLRNMLNEPSKASEKAYMKYGYEGFFEYYNILNSASKNKSGTVTKDAFKLALSQSGVPFGKIKDYLSYFSGK